MLTIFLLTLAGAMIGVVVGTLWYSDKTPMGRIHMKFLGFDKLSDEEKKARIQAAKPNIWKMYIVQIVLSCLTAFAVVFITIMSVRNGVPFSVAISFVIMNWLTFMVPTIGSSILWSNCDRGLAWKKFFSDITSNLITLILTAILTSFFV